MPICAALDIGSNSVRLLVGQVEGGQVHPLRQSLRGTRLMAGFQGGRLVPTAIERTIEGARELVAEARTFPLAGMAAVATSAAREAENAHQLLDGLRQATGLTAKIITGEAEALLNYRGVRAGLKHGNAERILVVDVGGGSTELSWKDHGRLNLRSIPLGAVRCTEARTPEAAMARALVPVLREVGKEGFSRVVATGGTATTLAAMEQGLRDYRPDWVHGFTLRRERIHYWRDTLKALPVEERRKIPGLQPERADIIVAGISILLEVLQGLGAEEVTVSEADLLWGLLLYAAGEEMDWCELL
ncbi:MAG: Ppx/GppA family phosphatase [Thermoanaerobacteraceae bacterium]|nr:Ppx/GppA family phosphatase [Thermoanaerobacteraceae bacterium]